MATGFNSPSASVRISTSSDVRVKPKLRGVVFDMDGTLTVPVIDFALMKRMVLGDDHADIKSGNTSRIDILHQIEQWSPDRQQKAYTIITDFERQAHERLQIMPGALELCEFLDSRQIRLLVASVRVPLHAYLMNLASTTVLIHISTHNQISR
uniref:Uncharacterized protein n=1 Tax=Picea sitchensis TaxID=3332 RepID=A9NNP4_PICSI|nr:unknown [Picea sitchensis]